MVDSMQPLSLATGWAPAFWLIVAGLPLVAGVLFFVLRSPVIGVLALTVFLPFNALATMLMRAHDIPGSALVGAFKDMVLVALLVAAFRSFRQGRRWGSRWIPALVGAILVLANISAVVWSTPEQGAYGWRNNYFPLLLLVALPLVLDAGDARRVARWIVRVVQVASLVTIGTWALGDSWLELSGMWPAAEFPYALVMDGRVRGYSPFSSANTAGVVYGMSLAVLWTVLKLPLAARGALSVLPLLAMGTTVSRSALLGLLLLATALLVRALTRWSPRMALYLLVAALSTGALSVTVYLGTHTVAELDRSFVGHFRSVVDALDLMWRSPLGVGVGNVGPRALRYDPDAVLVESFLLLVGLEAGWLMLALWMTLLATLVTAVASQWRTAAFVTVAALLAASVSLVVLPTMQEGPVAYFLWISTSLGLLFARTGRCDDATDAGARQFVEVRWARGLLDRQRARATARQVGASPVEEPAKNR